jgi:ornithine carbamoyltransferase
MMLGVNVRLASPDGYQLPASIVKTASRVARHGATIRLVTDPAEAVDGADAVYTDVWTSMGQEAETVARLKAFEDYQVTPTLMQQAAPGGLFLHCLPAHRGEEVSAEVLESPASVVFDQAENRLHAQKALLYMLMAEPAAM